MFSLTTSLVQILVQVAIFTGINGVFPINVGGSQKEEVTYQIYIALAAADFVVAVFALILLYGNERTDEIQGRKFLMPWAILIPFYIVYESAINILYFIWQFQNKYAELNQSLLQGGHSTGFIVVPLVYWIVKDIFLFVGFVYVVMRIQSLRPLHVQYVHEEYDQAYREPVPTHVRPSLALPQPVQMNSCSSCNACSGSRCGQCSKPTPLYGYAGQPSSNVQAKTGWTTSVYNSAR